MDRYRIKKDPTSRHVEMEKHKDGSFVLYTDHLNAQSELAKALEGNNNGSSKSDR